MNFVARNSGHRDPRSAQSYHNTDGVLGQKLQADMFGENVPDVAIGVGDKRSNVDGIDDVRKQKFLRFQDCAIGKKNRGYVRNRSGLDEKLERLDEDVLWDGVAVNSNSETIPNTNRLSTDFSPDISALSVFPALCNAQNITVNVYQNCQPNQGQN